MNACINHIHDAKVISKLAIDMFYKLASTSAASFKPCLQNLPEIDRMVLENGFKEMISSKSAAMESKTGSNLGGAPKIQLKAFV